MINTIYFCFFSFYNLQSMDVHKRSCLDTLRGTIIHTSMYEKGDDQCRTCVHHVCLISGGDTSGFAHNLFKIRGMYDITNASARKRPGKTSFQYFKYIFY